MLYLRYEVANNGLKKPYEAQITQQGVAAAVISGARLCPPDNCPYGFAGIMRTCFYTLGCRPSFVRLHAELAMTQSKLSFPGRYVRLQLNTKERLLQASRAAPVRSTPLEESGSPPVHSQQSQKLKGEMTVTRRHQLLHDMQYNELVLV